MKSDRLLRVSMSHRFSKLIYLFAMTDSVRTCGELLPA